MWGICTRNNRDKNFITDIASYSVRLIDGKSKPMYLVHGDAVFTRSGPTEYMSPMVLTRAVNQDSLKNHLMDKIRRNMLVPQKTTDVAKDSLRYMSFSNILECKCTVDKQTIKVFFKKCKTYITATVESQCRNTLLKKMIM